MKRFLIVLLAAVLITLAGCAGTPQAPVDRAGETDALLLGFSQLGSESSWRIGNTASVVSAAQNAGVQLMYENGEQKQEKQIKAIRSFIAYQVDVIAVAPIVEDGWDNVLREAKEAGIPVLTTDRMIKTDNDQLIAGFIGSDFYEEGQSAGKFLVRKAGNRDDVRIVEISGTIDSTPMRRRALGFRDAIAGHANLTMIDSVSGDFLRSKGKECMEALLDKHERIDVLYSHNDAMTLGAIESIQAHGLIPGKDVVIITVDGEQAVIDLLKEGKINCVVECTPMIGDTIMELAKRLAAGEQIERITYSQESVFSEFDEHPGEMPARGY